MSNDENVMMSWRCVQACGPRCGPFGSLNAYNYHSLNMLVLKGARVRALRHVFTAAAMACANDLRAAPLETSYTIKTVSLTIAPPTARTRP
jgi:hypothetical protein